MSTKLNFKDLLYYLDFKDENVWNENKKMIGYIEKEEIQSDGSIDYSKFFERIHGFKHHEQAQVARRTNPELYPTVDYLKTLINIHNKEINDLDKKVKDLTAEVVKIYGKDKPKTLITTKFYN